MLIDGERDVTSNGYLVNVVKGINRKGEYEIKEKKGRNQDMIEYSV
jgi:hypothetical protein